MKHVEILPRWARNVARDEGDRVEACCGMLEQLKKYDYIQGWYVSRE